MKNAERPNPGYHLYVEHREMQLFCLWCSLAGVWAASLKQYSPVSLIKQWKENRVAALRTRTEQRAQSLLLLWYRLYSRCALDAQTIPKRPTFVFALQFPHLTAVEITYQQFALHQTITQSNRFLLHSRVKLTCLQALCERLSCI